jgi:hypothetical protein
MRLLSDNLVETIKIVLATGGAAVLLWVLALRLRGREDVAGYYYSVLLVYGILGARREGLGTALCVPSRRSPG